MAETAAAERPLIDPLVAQIIAASASATADATNDVINHLEYRLHRAEAELATIRQQISDLHSGPWQPSQASVLEALWPSQALIDAWIEVDDA